MKARRGALRALSALAALLYGWAGLALPALHQLRHRADHVHAPGGAIQWLASDGEAEDGLDEASRPEVTHLAFDVDLAALDLADAAHLGVAPVDCSLARYTLVEGRVMYEVN